MAIQKSSGTIPAPWERVHNVMREALGTEAFGVSGTWMMTGDKGPQGPLTYAAESLETLVTLEISDDGQGGTAAVMTFDRQIRPSQRRRAASAEYQQQFQERADAETKAVLSAIHTETVVRFGNPADKAQKIAGDLAGGIADLFRKARNPKLDEIADHVEGAIEGARDAVAEKVEGARDRISTPKQGGDDVRTTAAPSIEKLKDIGLRAGKQAAIDIAKEGIKGGPGGLRKRVIQRGAEAIREAGKEAALEVGKDVLKDQLKRRSGKGKNSPSDKGKDIGS